MRYILSTLTSAQDYTFYDVHNNAFNRAEKIIHINGGANVADKHFITKDGIMTEISDSDLELLQTHPVFKMHMQKGFIKILKNEKEENKAKQDMQIADGSAPLTPESYKDDEDSGTKKSRKVKVGKVG